jgi:cytochrome P450
MQSIDPLDPYPWYQRMRKDAPVFFDDKAQVWRIFRYHEVQQVLKDHVTFRSFAPLAKDVPPLLPFTNPPEHSRLRRLASQAFVPRMQALTPRIIDLAKEQIDRIEDASRMDVVDEFAYPFTESVMVELLGLPLEDRFLFRHWGEHLTRSASMLDTSSPPGMVDYILRLIEQRRKASERVMPDFITTLLLEQANEQEIIGLLSGLLIAGTQTTQLAIAWTLFCLLEHPAAMKAVRANRALLPGAIDESLRYRAPFPMVARVTGKETVLAGQRIEADQTIFAMIASANHDETQFPDADRFDMLRSPHPPHLAFGGGIHACLGAPLARLETQIALDVLLSRLNAIHRLKHIPLEPVGGGLTYGLKHLIIGFENQT